MSKVWTYLATRCAMIALVGDPTPALADVPDWVTERPQQSGYAVGIGGAETGEDALSIVRHRATAAALADIAAQLQIDVVSAAAHSAAEDDDGFTSSYESTTRIASSAALQDVKIVATWCGEQNCWVYARLDLRQREASLRENADRRRQRLEELLERLADPSSSAAVALAAGAEAASLADDNTLVMAPWLQRFAGITLTGIEQLGTPAIEVIALDRGLPAIGLPVRFAISPSTSRVDPLVWTDGEGRARATIEALHGSATVTACIDVAVAVAVPSPPRRCVTTIVDQPRRRAHLELTVDPTAQPVLQAEVAAMLTAGGLDIVTRTDTASLSINVNLRVSPVTVTGGIHFTRIDVAVAVADRGETIHATTASRIRGAGLTRGEAIVTALRTPGAGLLEATTHGRRVRVRVTPRRSVLSGGSSS
ncbi:MAG: LPP20 family lipoprotein [Candidatus Latescibacteria bacterium]|jgi:hypothetical protein|nr:LPP20 family lipoprotein [Candidatus Latescibacterota bacterium]